MIQVRPLRATDSDFRSHVDRHPILGSRHGIYISCLGTWAETLKAGRNA
jgi:hypothetical protein